MNEVLEQYRNRLIQQRYSQNTIDIYCNYFKDFCNIFKDSKLQNIKPEQINEYILDLIKIKNIFISPLMQLLKSYYMLLILLNYIKSSKTLPNNKYSAFASR